MKLKTRTLLLSAVVILPIAALSWNLFTRFLESHQAGQLLGSNRTSSIPMPPGYRGVSLPVPGTQTLFLKSGERIDLLVTFDAVMGRGGEERLEKVTATMLQNTIVLNVSRPDRADGAGVVQLLCNPNEAQYAALSLVQGKSLNLIRRAPGDTELRPMEIATFRRLIK